MPVGRLSEAWKGVAGRSGAVKADGVARSGYLDPGLRGIMALSTEFS
jgi:hypothetical protein